jgi:hypothetical protein
MGQTGDDMALQLSFASNHGRESCSDLFQIEAFNHEHEGEANEYKDHETRSVLDREPDALIRQFLPVTHKGPFRRSYGINDTRTGGQVRINPKLS